MKIMTGMVDKPKACIDCIFYQRGARHVKPGPMCHGVGDPPRSIGRMSVTKERPTWCPINEKTIYTPMIG